MTGMLAAVRLRGVAKPGGKFNGALRMINLRRANHCVLLADGPASRGALGKVKYFVTYGEVSEDVVRMLITKRGRKAGNKKLTEKETSIIIDNIRKSKSLKGLGLKPYFRLSPPSGGLKSVKHHYPKGDLGYRGEGINKLLESMI
jgi:large subunit ribosomal protein L30